MKSAKFIVTLIALCSFHFVFAQRDSIESVVYFKYDKYYVQQQYRDKLLYDLQPYDGIDSIRIIGFTDAKGGFGYNDLLSLNRANAVKDFLISTKFQGLISVGTSGFGKRKLQIPTEDSNWQNRLAIVIAYLKPPPPEVKPIPVTPHPVDTASNIPVDSGRIPETNIETVPVTTIEPVRMPKIINSIGSGKELIDKVIKTFKESEVGESVVLTTINFYEGRHIHIKESEDALNAALETLRSMPKLEVEIQGHVCCADPAEADVVDLDTKEFKLSFNRAKAIYEYMVKHGIAPQRMRYAGYGGRRRLIYPEKTSNDALKNRRVEFLILKK